MPSFWTCKSHLKISGVKPRTPWKPSFSWRRPRTRPFESAWPTLCPHRPPPLWLPGESLLGGAGETHQEDGWPPDQPPQAGWSSGWVKGVSLGSTTRDLWSLLDFEEPLWCQVFYMKPLAAATRQLFNPPGDLSQTLDQMQTIRLFAEKNKWMRN